MKRYALTRGRPTRAAATSWRVYRLRPGLPMAGTKILFVAINGSLGPKGVYKSRSDRRPRRAPGRQATSLLSIHVPRQQTHEVPRASFYRDKFFLLKTAGEGVGRIVTIARKHVKIQVI
jgi:hypothetical protein